MANHSTSKIATQTFFNMQAITTIYFISISYINLWVVMEVKRGENSHHLLYCTILSSARHCTFLLVFRLHLKWIEEETERRRNKKWMGKKNFFMFLAKFLFLCVWMNERNGEKKNQCKGNFRSFSFWQKERK